MENLAQITWHYEDGIKVTDEPIGSAELHCADVPKAAEVRWAVSKLVCNYQRANKVLKARNEYNPFKSLWEIHVWILAPSPQKSS